MFFGIIKFGPLTLLERELILLASVLLAWATYRFVETPFRFGRPEPAQDVRRSAPAWCWSAIAGGVVVCGSRL